jgi:hypothetical protein
MVEAKRGGGRGGSGVDSSPRPALAFIGASTRHAKNTFKTPPPIFLAARLLEINIQNALVCGTGPLTGKKSQSDVLINAY